MFLWNWVEVLCFSSTAYDCSVLKNRHGFVWSHSQRHGVGDEDGHRHFGPWFIDNASHMKDFAGIILAVAHRG